MCMHSSRRLGPSWATVILLRQDWSRQQLLKRTRPRHVVVLLWQLLCECVLKLLLLLLHAVPSCMQGALLVCPCMSLGLLLSASILLMCEHLLVVVHALLGLMLQLGLLLGGPLGTAGAWRGSG